jgi:O-antigen/teichoic acid export membrane protein
MALADMSQSVTQAGLQVAFGLVGLSVAGLLGGWVVGAVVGVLILGYTAWRSGRAAFAEVSLRRMWEVGTRYRRFALLTTPSVLMNTIGLRAPLLVLIAIYGSGVGGLYALAERVAILPVTLAAAAVGQVYYAHAAPLARRQDDALKDLFIRTTRTLALYAIVPMVLVAVLAPTLFGLIFGEDWVEAGVYSAILAPWFYVILITNPTGRTLDVLERQDLHLTRESIRLGVLGLTVLLVLLVQPAPIGAVLLLSIAGCTTYSIYGYISWRAIVSDRPRRGADPPGMSSVTDSAGSP